MEFTTKIELPQLNLNIDYIKRGMMLGSCFADSIADLMLSARFAVTKNPFGVLYNPQSIAGAIMRLNSGEEFGRDELCNRGDMWFSFAHHGSFSSTDPVRVLNNINTVFSQAVTAFRSADYVIITFGTAWVFRRSDTGEVVANCHKLPACEFVRERMSVADIVSLYGPLLEGVLGSKKVLFTVSPIRHVKDGLQQNAISKATLLVAIDELRTKYGNVEYFPSYEIMMDELRDYRFYKEDMVHPTDQAVEYIWTLFQQTAMNQQTRDILQQIDQLRRAVNHRPFNPNSESHQLFCSRMLAVAQTLAQQNPAIDFTNELNYFKQ